MKKLTLAVLSLSLILSCNKEDYFGKSLAVEGADAKCSAGTDLASCEAITGCQVAYEDVEAVNPVFAACIANPPQPGDEVPATDSGSMSSAGSNSGSNSGSSSDVPDEDKVPTVSDAYNSNCQNLPAGDYYSKNYSSDNGQSVKVKKVKVCHQTSHGEHAIIVACPALKAHKKHIDYLGACKE
ncbi:MAG: hypothetical protein ACJ76H_00015 [Bacteriovoracaceae bacterium]